MLRPALRGRCCRIESGLYSAANLQPGTYEVKVELPSFAVELHKDINLNVGSELVIDFALHVAGSTETVEVTAENSNVDLVASTVSRTVEGTTIRELPLNGRDWSQSATLEPGIANIGNGGAGGRDGDGYKMTVSGARPSENNFRLDGVSLIDSSNSTPGNVLGTNLGVEAVREFSVVSNSYSAEYGRATGAVVNAVTKSGGNIHPAACSISIETARSMHGIFSMGPSSRTSAGTNLGRQREGRLRKTGRSGLGTLKKFVSSSPQLQSRTSSRPTRGRACFPPAPLRSIRILRGCSV